MCISVLAVGILVSTRRSNYGSSVASNSVTELLADPTIVTTRVDSLDCAADHAGSAKPKQPPPASNQRSLKNAEDLLQ